MNEPFATDSASAPDPGARRPALLMVDDEDSILSSLRRLLRREPYEVVTANGGQAGLDELARRPFDVIVSDQRMPGMNGVEFLRRAKERYPDTVRMVLSGYADLQSITDAINEGAIYKFLAKPWDDEHLKSEIAEAFRRKALHDENRRLAEELRVTNAELTRVNARLEEALAAQSERAAAGESALAAVQEIVNCLPLPLLGVDLDGLIVFANADATQRFAGHPLVGSFAGEALPEAVAALATAGGGDAVARLGGAAWQVACRPVEAILQQRGYILTFVPVASS